jgi:tetratricopeptide (TPR) repeat protein
MNISSKKWATYWHNLLTAEILLAEGFSEKAIDVFEKEFLPFPPYLQNTDNVIFCNTPFHRDVLARAYLKKGDLDKAIAEYERLITFNPSSRDRRLVNPKYHYRLAKLHEQKGWIGKAIEHYEKFLTLWKDADPGIAEVEDAKKRLAGLKSH